MYLSRATINGLEETAIYPIVLVIAQDVLKLLGLPQSIPIRIGENPPLRLTKDGAGQIEHIPDIPNDELFIEYAESFTDDYNVALTGSIPSTGYIYKDPDVHSFAAAIRSRRTLSLTFNYFSKSKSKTTALINRLKMREVGDTRQYVHDIQYHYYAPDVLMDLVDAINTLKNTYTNPVIDMDDYIANTFDTRANVLNDETGNSFKIKLAIRSKQDSVIGTIDTDVRSLEKTLDTDTNRWNTSFEYSAEYELPTQLLVGYPIAVYNQPIPTRFRLPDKSNVNTGRHSSDSIGIDKLTARPSQLLSIPDGEYYLKIPYQDNLTLHKPDTGYVRLFSVVSIIDTTAPTDLFYLDELPGITIAPDVISLIKLEAPRIAHRYASIFNIEIFNYTKRMSTHKVIVTPVTEVINGVSVDRVKLTTDLPLDIRGMYRISFNVLSDLTNLPTKFLDTLKTNITTVDNSTNNDFSVLDTVMSVLDLDRTKLDPNLIINNDTSSLTIALNINSNLWNRVFTRQTSIILTEILKPK